MRSLKLYSVALSLSLALVLATPAQAFAPVHKQVALHKLAPKKVSLAMSHPKMFAHQLLILKGFGVKEYGCLVSLWDRESRWWYKSKNRTSTAFGIAQMLTETSHDPAIQIIHGISYISNRYGSPCQGWAFWQRNYYY